MKKRTRRRLSNILYRLFIAILLIVFALCTFQLYVLWTEKEVVVKREKAITEKVVTKDKYLEPDWEALRAQNPDIIGWIYVPDCDINFPLVYRSGDNKRYLSTDASGYYDEYGAIFLDGFASADFSDMNSVIYGHSVLTGGRFTNLKYFAAQDFFDSHPYFYLLTPAKTWRCKVYTFARVPSNSIHYQASFTEDELNQVALQSMYSRTLDEVGYNPEIPDSNHFVTLSTCDLSYGLDSNRRIVLSGYMKEYTKRIRLKE